MMTKKEQFLATLNDQEKKLIKNGEVEPNPFSLCWYYKVQSEYAAPKEAERMERRKAELYGEWKTIGLVE